MIPRVQEIEDIIEEGTGMKLQRAKTRVLLSKARAPDDAVFDLAVQFGIRRENVLVDGAEVMGCPVGTDEFIDRWMDVKVDDAVRDMATLKYFSDVHRWPVLLYCVNQRVTHLQRLLPLDLGKAQLKKFDDAITDEVFNQHHGGSLRGQGGRDDEHGAQAARAATRTRRCSHARK